MLRIRTIARPERDAVLDLLKNWFGDRDFFQRYFDNDPAFRDDLCLVADDDGRIVSTLQIFPKTIAVEGGRLRLGGIGNVFTLEEYRSRGIASQVVRRAVEIMEAGGFDVSLLFATRLTFYSQFGWGSQRRQLGAVVAPEEIPAPAHRIRPFEPARDLDAVMKIYDAYNRNRPGAVVRDRRYWEGQLRYAGNPEETFLVAEREDRVLAYARLAGLYGVQTIMEHGAAEGATEALRDVVAALVEQTREFDFCVIHLGADCDLRAELGRTGFTITEVEDVFAMWRVINAEQIARKLGIEPAAVEAPDFFERLLPWEGSVYWTSDRF